MTNVTIIVVQKRNSDITLYATDQRYLWSSVFDVRYYVITLLLQSQTPTCMTVSDMWLSQVW